LGRTIALAMDMTVLVGMLMCGVFILKRNGIFIVCSILFVVELYVSAFLWLGPRSWVWSILVLHWVIINGFHIGSSVVQSFRNELLITIIEVDSVEVLVMSLGFVTSCSRSRPCFCIMVLLALSSELHVFVPCGWWSLLIELQHILVNHLVQGLHQVVKMAVYLF